MYRLRWWLFGLSIPSLVPAIIVLAFADSVIIKAVDIGIGVAVVLDATVVRALPVPATMRLMGRWNWWMPAPIARLWRWESAPAARGCSTGSG